MANLDLEKARKEMREKGLDAIIAMSPENFYYASGFQSQEMRHRQEAGLAIALIPSASDLPPAVIVGDWEEISAKALSDIPDVRAFRLWMDVADVRSFDLAPGVDMREVLATTAPSQIKRRPEQYDLHEIFQLLADVLVDRGLSQGSIGIEMDFISYHRQLLLARHLPEARFADCTNLFYELRSVKNSREIELLRKAARLGQKAIMDAREKLAEGVSQMEIFSHVRASVARQALEDPSLGHVEEARGAILIGDKMGAPRSPASLGDIIDMDIVVNVEGYHSDQARTFVLGHATEQQKAVHAALLKAHEQARLQIAPGRAICDIFAAAESAMKKQGFSMYNRGHIGHSIGLNRKTEEPPFISAVEGVKLQPNMVICVETPYYLAGLGPFQIEDMILVTEKGHEVLTDLPRSLVEL